jgi:hypothetical protein
MHGRQIDFKLTSNVLGGDFRFGKFQFETMGGGKRR